MLEFALTFMQALPGLIAEGTSAYEAITGANAALAGMAAANRGPTDAEWDTLNALIAGQLASLKD